MTTPLKPGEATSASGEAELVSGGQGVNQALRNDSGGLEFTVNAKPAPQGSKKHVGGGRMVEMSKNLPAWRTAVAAAAKAAWPYDTAMDCPVGVVVEFRLQRPKKSKFGDHPAGPPDTDKLCRATGDALEAAGIVTNDSRIVHWDARKVWGEPGATITITEMSTQ